MQSKAYVLIEAEAGQVGTVIATLRDTAGVSAADPVTGPYDIIVVVETDNQREIGRLVMDTLHQITGVKRTITCLAI
ncbi:MAG: Lrp/AsnC ligand binding domain-containing protein [Roseiflexaceae bacterium]|nr:Lrp/AsnC ligand binding domain-containing protein [Roseiflexaceae bacterium]